MEPSVVLLAAAPRAGVLPAADTSQARACLHLYLLSLKRQVFTAQTVISFVLTLLSCMLVVAWTKWSRMPSVNRFAEHALMPLHVAFLLPLFAICFGASSVGGDREDRTLIYLLITPLPRPLIYLTKLAAALTLSLVWSIGSLVALCGPAGPAVRAALRTTATRAADEAAHWGLESLGIFLPAVLLGTIAYTLLFHLLGAAFRRGTIISLAYAFFLELLLGNMPGIVKRVSVSFYISCMIYDAGSEHALAPRVAPELFLPISGDAATVVLGLVTIFLLALGLGVFTRREYRDLS